MRHAVRGRRELDRASGDGVPSNQPFKSRGLSSTAVLITGYRNEFTRGVLTALGSLVVVGILALLVAFGVSVLF